MKCIRWLTSLCLIAPLLLQGQSALPVSGRDFWMAVPDRIDRAVVNVVAMEATNATLSFVDGDFQRVLTLAKGQSASVTLPDVATFPAADSLVRSLAVRVYSSAPVTVALRLSGADGSAETLVLPLDALDTHNLLPGRAAWPSGARFAMVVSPFDGNRLHLANGDTRLLQRGDAVLLASDPDDPATPLVSEHPVAVLAGRRVDGDLAAEQLLPPALWSASALIAPDPGGDVAPSAAAVTVIAREDQTPLFLDGQSLATLSAGETRVVPVNGPAVIHSNDPERPLLAISEREDSGRSWLVAPHGRHLLGEHRWFIPGESAVIHIWTRATARDSLRLDGTPLAADAFTPAGDGSILHAALPLLAGEHVLTGPATVTIADIGGRRMAGGALPSWVTVTLLGTPTLGEDLAVAVRAPSVVNPEFRFLCYRHPGDAHYTISNLEPSEGGWRGTIPGEWLTERGVEYHVSFSEGLMQRSYPPVDAELHPVAVPVAMTAYISPNLSLVPNRFAMVSIPLRMDVADLQAALEDDYGSYAPERWRLFRWDAAEERYREPLDGEGPMTIAPGEAFWLITADGLPFDVDSARSPDVDRPAEITVPAGWSQIASPFPFAVAWDSIAGGADLRGPFAFDGVEYRPAATLDPWSGAFIFNPGAPLTLTVPPLAAEDGLARGTGATGDGEIHRLRLSLAASGEPRDTWNWVAWTTGGRIPDTAQLPDAPPVTESARLSIVDEEQRWMQRVSQWRPEGLHWTIDVSRVPGDDPLDITVTPEDGLPEGTAITLFDTVDGRRLSLRNGRVDLDLAEGESRRLRVVVAPAGASEAHAPVPVTAVLAQNYPNPFNPATTVEFALSAPGRVTLTVYDITGRRLAVLVDGMREAGRHAVEWNGRDAAGHAVASGIYLYRLETGGATATRKMTLIR